METKPQLLPSSSFDSLPPLIHDNITVNYPDGTTKQFPRYSTLSDILKGGSFKESSSPIVGAFVNAEIIGLAERIPVNVHDVNPICLDSIYGSEIYRRTLTFICAKAANKLFPKKHFTINHSLGTAFYYRLEGEKEDDEVTEEDLKKLDAEMRSLVKQSLPIIPQMISWYDAVDYLSKANITEALKLIKTLNIPRIPIIVCDNFFHLAHGPHLNNTNMLNLFNIIKYGDKDGFLLQFPHTRNYSSLDPWEDQPKLFKTFQNTKKWERKAGIECVGDVNEIVRNPDKQKLKDFVVFCEAVHDRTFVEAAALATSNPKTKIILIAGPSSSGKTTFARKLCVHLRVLGKTPICISLDDFYNEPDKNPTDPITGEKDFEALEALNLKLINDTFLSLLSGKTTPLPRYNFLTQKSEFSGKELKMNEDSMLVVEGIHGLNDKLTEMIPREAKFKIFVSALTALNLDEHTRVPTTDNRLLRRMVRDYQFRGTSAIETFKRWPSVRAGEEKHIFPFQNTADIIFNSSVEYEINALKEIAEPLLKSIVPEQKEYYPQAQRLLRFLEDFELMKIESTIIPPTALVREFIGGSVFQD